MQPTTIAAIPANTVGARKKLATAAPETPITQPTVAFSYQGI